MPLINAFHSHGECFKIIRWIVGITLDRCPNGPWNFQIDVTCAFKISHLGKATSLYSLYVFISFAFCSRFGKHRENSCTNLLRIRLVRIQCHGSLDLFLGEYICQMIMETPARVLSLCTPSGVDIRNGR